MHSKTVSVYPHLQASVHMGMHGNAVILTIILSDHSEIIKLQANIPCS